MRLKLILPILATMLVPLAAAFFKYPDTHIPPGFLVFPPQFIVEEPSFNLIYFLLMLVAVVWALLVLFWPEKVGFKRNTQPMPSPTRANLPWWFYIGLGGTVLFWWLMWSRSEAMLPWVYYAFTPLWWSFIILLDGIVYRFNGGRSLCATKPGLLLFMAGVSFFGWMYFEYYDYFVLENWYYPNAEKTSLSREMILLLFCFSYTTVTPAIMQWYTLLCTFPSIRKRYRFGPVWHLKPNWLIYGGLASIFLMVFFPKLLFWAVWIGPMAVMTGILERYGIWNPFHGILTSGNWTSAALVGMASLINGFFWEMWNFGSAHPDTQLITNPNYWVYDIPFVNLTWLPLPTEMPLLGYMGYVPFGILVWQVLIWSGKIMGINTDLREVTDWYLISEQKAQFDTPCRAEV
ncbi:TPA: mechanosensitive ion channel protein MscS [Vibrio vulnificus]|uniref:mechanosensitive ion channel protein MscS n=1 Tax=Vibrio vulnificus TaxID=672 RepID=UPI0028CBD081|nr:mechanosensitive ion channel protein MscS [Vibrio vulnificus]